MSEENPKLDSNYPRWRRKLHDIIFYADSFWGKAFDVTLLILIFSSVVIVILESVQEYRTQYSLFFKWFEWIFTVVFTVEYLLRIIVVKKPKAYIFSFFGIIDFISIIPTYLSFFIPGAQSFLIIRGLRLLRIFRVFKLTHYLGEASLLSRALMASKNKIIIFIGTVLILVCIMGATMYLIEPPESGFTNIPKGIYWSIVTLTTVGYGDIAPITPLGQFLASLIMIIGYGIIAVPTGIVTSEIQNQSNADRQKQAEIKPRVCTYCGHQSAELKPNFCAECGERLKS